MHTEANAFCFLKNVKQTVCVTQKQTFSAMMSFHRKTILYCKHNVSYQSWKSKETHKKTVKCNIKYYLLPWWTLWWLGVFNMYSKGPSVSISWQKKINSILKIHPKLQNGSILGNLVLKWIRALYVKQFFGTPPAFTEKACCLWHALSETDET